MELLAMIFAFGFGVTVGMIIMCLAVSASNYSREKHDEDDTRK